MYFFIVLKKGYTTSVEFQQFSKRLISGNLYWYFLAEKIIIDMLLSIFLINCSIQLHNAKRNVLPSKLIKTMPFSRLYFFHMGNQECIFNKQLLSALMNILWGKKIVCSSLVSMYSERITI